MAQANRRWPWVLLVLVVVVPGAIYGLQTPTKSRPVPTPPPPSASATLATTPVPTQMIDGFPAPATYWQACSYEPSVCNPNDPTLPNAQGSLPAALRRPLRLPVLRLGQSCPTSAASDVETPAFGGTAIGAGPVRSVSPSVVDLASTPNSAGWYGSNSMTIWFSEPSYQGPWILRGTLLDGASPVIFGDPPALTASLLVPPIDTINTSSGYRWVPGGTYVRGPGCYAVQVDGLGFSYDVVFQAILTPH